MRIDIYYKEQTLKNLDFLIFYYRLIETWQNVELVYGMLRTVLSVQ